MQYVPNTAPTAIRISGEVIGNGSPDSSVEISGVAMESMISSAMLQAPNEGNLKKLQKLVALGVAVGIQDEDGGGVLDYVFLAA